MKKYTSKNYGKGFRRCKKFDYYLAKWKASVRKPYRGINAFLEVFSEDERKDFAAKVAEWYKKSLVVKLA